MRLSVALLLPIFALGAQLALGVPATLRKDACNQPCRGFQDYDVTFHFRWDGKKVDPGYPAGAYFSAPFAVPHNNDFRLFEDKQIATKGLAALARDGEFGPLKDELKVVRDSKVLRWKWGGSEKDRVGTVGNVKISKLQLREKGEMFMVSTVVRIAPSPDWFLGASVDMCDHCTGKWVERAEPKVRVFDAGVVDGDSYIVTPQTASEPQKPVTLESKHQLNYAALVIERSGGGLPAWKVVVTTIAVIAILLIVWKFVYPRIFRREEDSKESVIEVW